MSSWDKMYHALTEKKKECPEEIRELSMQIGSIRAYYFCYVLNLPFVDDKKYLPKESGVYFLVDMVKHEIIYIGKSINLYARWKSRPELLISETARLYYLADEGYIDIDIVEAFFIALFLPKHNQVIRCNVSWNGWDIYHLLTGTV